MMLAFYPNCIFCGKELPPPDKRGKGEHIIPEFIFGSVKIKDVCPKCNNKLGTEVDSKILEDPRIILAIRDLNITPLKNKIIAKGTTTGKDTKDRHVIEYKSRNGKFSMIPTPIEPDGIEHPESDAKSVLINMARRRRHPAFTEDEAVYYVENILWPDYEKLEPGQEINARPIGRTIVKKQATVEKTTFKQSEKAAYRLVAKIIYEMCWYMLEPATRECLSDDIIYFGKLANGEADYEEYRIIYRPVRELLEPDFYHLIQFHFESGYVLVDVDFFKSVNFRVTLRANKSFPLPIMEGKETEGFGIFMSFDPKKDKRKGCAFKFKDENKWAEYDIPGL
jgi:hypothetical protein